MALCVSAYSKCKATNGRYGLLNIVTKSVQSKGQKRHKVSTDIIKIGFRETFFEG